MPVPAQASGVEPQFYSLVWPTVFVTGATLIYLLVDVYLTTKTFTAIFKTAAFFLLWLVYAILALLAYGAIQVAAGDKLLAFVGHPQLARLFQVLLAVGGALTIFQSFTVKIADFKVLDLGQVVDRFRASVYSAIGEQVVNERKRRDRSLAEKLAVRFETTPDRLRDELNSLLQFAGIDGPEIITRLDGIRAHAAATSTSEIRGFATAIVLLDSQRAEDLLG